MRGRFIISTGRSGSTLLSKMVAENRKVLVLSEFMAGIEVIGLAAGRVSGQEFAALLLQDEGLSLLLKQRDVTTRERLNMGRPGGPVAPRTGGIPSLLRTAFPSMQEDSETLFTDALAFASQQPTRPVGSQLNALFEWLCARFGRQTWVERSGFNIRMFPWIRGAFPQARFLHLHRDGIEAALSMQHHPWFRVGVYFDFHPPQVETLVAAIRNPSTGPEDPVSRFRNEAPPAEMYGRHWSNMLCRAFRHLVHVPSAHYAELRFEDLMKDVRKALTELAEFFSLPEDAGWIERAMGLLEPDPPARAPNLSETELARLREACLPGQILLGRADPSQLDVALERIRAAHAIARGADRGPQDL